MMHIIPDQIKNFWTERGYKVEPIFNTYPEKPNSIKWGAYKDYSMVFTIALTRYEDIPAVYYWDGKVYSEAEALKLYKMKAFL